MSWSPQVMKIFWPLIRQVLATTKRSIYRGSDAVA